MSQSVFQAFQPIALITTTPTGFQTLQRLGAIGTLWLPAAIATNQPEILPNQTIQVYTDPLKTQIANLWSSHQAFIFCLSTGAVVRLIAPLLQDKATDPAVIVIDEAGKFVISLSGGHQAGGDRLTQVIARQLSATPVLTGAANHLNLPGIDILGEPFGWVKGIGDWTGVSAAIARQLPVEVIQEVGSTLWQTHLPADHPFQFGFPEHTATVQETRPATAARIWISPIQRQFAPDSNFPKVQWHPRVLWVGIGCERGTPKTVIEQAIQQVFQAHHLAEGAIAGIATIDLKADEVGLVEFCRDRQLPLCCFAADTLATVPVPHPSAVVEAEVGTPSVAEAAAIVASWGVGGDGEDRGDGEDKGDREDRGDREIHLASSPSPPSSSSSPSSPPSFSSPSPSLRVTKQIFRLEGQPGAVTIAIAQAEEEYTGRVGKLWLVGTGPGELAQITPAAQTAIAQADVVIGYSLYIDLIRSLCRPGQIIEALPITQERQRAERAIELAQWGLTVAVVSSGDCGIYGMAGLVLEQLRAQGWDGQTPGVQVFPGITALQAAASRVGAPLMHDFCAISLSDLLTPWEVIEKRLQAVAQADFVVALYNPKSQTRTEQIAIAQRIFLQHRDPQTPVALVRSAYRATEQITLTTLGELLNQSIDMLTTVLIGNQSTRRHADWLITPRGYLGFDPG